MQTTVLDGILFSRLLRGGAANLKANITTVNDLNVFPIPDGDTGDNMFLTINSGATAAGEGSESLSQTAGKAASGMLLGARGNSGVILSRIFAGLSKGFEGIAQADVRALGRAFESGVSEAYSAVSVPVEGTILTVLKDSVTAANGNISDSSTLESYFADFNSELKQSLERTPDLLDVLKEAGVVDSGGAGLGYIIEGMINVLGGAEVALEAEGTARAKSVDLDAFGADSVLEFGYCTEFLLRLQTSKVDIDNFDVDELITYLNSVGESVVCFREGTVVKVHVHTKTPGNILNHMQRYGEFLTFKMENMTLQHNENHMQEKFAPKVNKPHKPFGVVSVAAGSGIKDAFISLGCDVVVDGGQSMNPSAEDMIAAFRKWGFPVAPWSRACATIEEVFAAIDELETLRHTFRFEIDGAVVKIDERELYDVLGATAHGPRWARAYKYAPERAETVVESITVQVGRTGILTPVAELRPTELAGSTISRATLHNADQIARQDIRIGDHVWLVKAGDVIPAIESVIVEKRNGSERVFVMPARCPVCGGEVRRLDGEVATRCVNPACPAQLARRVEHFASRDALDLRALGETVVDALVAQKLIADPLDLFRIEVGELAALDISGHRFGKNAQTVIDAIKAARDLPLHRWLYAVGIPNVGVTVAKTIAAEHERLSDLADSEVLKNVLANDELKGKNRKILAIKAEAARAVLSFFASDYGRRFLKRMKELGIDPKAEAKAQVKTTGPLAGAGCVLTGTLSRPRGEYAKLIEQAGGIVQSSVNVGATKTEKARALGTEVIDEARLLEMLSEGG